jgi:hypothetical protein
MDQVSGPVVAIAWFSGGVRALRFISGITGQFFANSP